MKTVTQKELRRLLREKRGRKHKYNARRAMADGIKFPSKRERDFYLILKEQKKRGRIAWFLRQVPFDLPGGTKYVLDFLIFNSDGTVRLVDVKGHRTPAFIKAKKQVEALYPVEIEER